MGNAKQRKQEKTAKELLALGRDARQVRANALAMEEEVRKASVTIGELRATISQLELDRNAWKERAVTTEQARQEAIEGHRQESARADSNHAELDRERAALSRAEDRVAELEAGLEEMPKLRRRLQERAVEIADLQKKMHGLEALLKRHERNEADRNAMLAGVKSAGA